MHVFINLALYLLTFLIYSTNIMIDNLLDRALVAAQSAYAPYSQFRVGAAVELEDGTIITGSNQENASYSLSICAERVALFYARAHYPHLRVVTLAVTSPSTDRMVTPCGACRQVMTEVAFQQGCDFDVVMSEKTLKVSELLPLAFNL